MKKFAAIILLLLYATGNFGLAMRLDFCGESISNIALFSGEKQLAECCQEMDIPEDCCQSQLVFLQDDTDKSLHASLGFNLSNLTAIVVPAAILYAPTHSIEQSRVPTLRKAPPLESSQRQHLYCLYLI
ncbi:MAG: hypothetical protein GC180_00515 [Bacteroidetes bacterium]|nr:hypothetical protein [Bacteroidota bacterium]